MKYESGEALNVALGTLGGVIITDTDEYIGTYAAIMVLNDAVFTALESDNIIGDIAGLTITAGTVLYGLFTSITLASGAVIAYNG